MTRLASLIGALFGCALALLVVGPGCASAPDRLVVLATLNNASAAAIDAYRKDHERRLLADLQSRLAACHDPEPQAHQLCVVQAGRDALTNSSAEETRILELGLVQQSAASAIETAAACRRDHLDCAEAALKEAERAVASLRAELEREQKAAGAGEGGR